MKLGCFAAPRRTLIPAFSPRFFLPTGFSGTRFSPLYGVKLVAIDGTSKVKCEISEKGRKEEESEVLEELRSEAEEILGWDSICDQVSRFASTSGGRALCRSGGLRIGRDRSESQRLLEQTAATVSLLPRKLDFSGVEDVSELVRLAASGEVLGVRDLCAVERSLRAARRLYEQLVEVSLEQGSQNRYLPLIELFTDCIFMTEWMQNIGNCIDNNLFVILDRASSKLESIRSERRKNMDNLEVSLKSISFRIFQGGGIDSPLVTKRRSRMCVGIRASHKSLLPNGIVLGVSSSGATYFMEPRDVMELNNMEVRLSNSEKEEELSILSKLTSELACSQREVIHLMERIHELDIASARGAYAAWMNAACPIFSELPEEIESNRREESLMVDIEGIQHPLFLETSFRNLTVSPLTESDEGIEMDERVESDVNRELARSETVVPLDIKIKYSTKVVIISGPNTGGKTVSMKTLGLASLMSKAGLYLPARNKPRIPWFDQVLADIGDHQSLEHNLSTFSGHISRLCKILDAASRQSLVLVDEIGNGTDPSEGVVLSISILQHLVDRANLAVVTTHYTDLTLLKARDSRFENAAMEFSIETLKPTYHILWGSTGNSNALSIAKSIGFDQNVLDHAQVWVEKLLPDKQKERQGLLYQSLLEERNKLETQARKAESILLVAKELFTEIHSEAEDLSRRVATLKSMETQKVHREVNAVKNQMDIIVKNFENQLKSANPNQFGALLRQAEASIASLVEAHSSNDDIPLEKNEKTQCTLQVGDQVRVKTLGGKLATIVGALGDDGYAMVQYGKIRLRVQRNDLNLIKRNINIALKSSHVKGQDRQQGFKNLTKKRNTDENVPFGAAVQTSKNTVNLRGMRVEEASNYLHLAISGCKAGGVLFVIHGMGTGALKQCTLAILSKHPRVVKYDDESPMNYGCTVVYIK